MADLESKSTAELEKLVAAARSRYADLRGKASTRSFRHVLMTRDDLPAGGPGGDQERIETVAERAASTSKRRRVGDVHVAYRLSGHTIFPMAPHESGIRFETSFGGEFFEQYYAFVKFDDGNHPTLHRHTLPTFVPVARLAESLQDGLKPFMVAVSNHLNAYVGRREQVRRMQSDRAGDLVGEARCSSAVDYVAFALRDGRANAADGATLDVKLLYERLDSMLPTRAVVKAAVPGGEGAGERDRDAERAFKTRLLADAVAEALADG